MEPRPLIAWPTWDGKLVLAGLFIVGYYTLVILMATRPLPAANAQLVRDALITLGPPIGLIFGALFRTTGADERAAALRSSDLQTAIMAPPTALPTPELKSAVETGAARGTEAGVRAATGETAAAPLAADGIRRDWLDTPGAAEAADAEDPTWPQ